MKKSLLLALILLPLSFALSAQSSEQSEQNEQTDGKKAIAINPKTGFPIITEKPFIMFNEGISFAQVNRIEKQKNTSNFVRENYMIGAYLSLQSGNMKPLNSMLRVAAYYPFYNTFNGMRVYPKQTILYAFDLFYGPMLQTDMWKYVRLNFAAGLHYMYQLTDEYHMHYLGGAVLAGVELPVARHWTILMNGTFTLDYPNFGTNQKVQPFDYAWQYQVELGVRYSVKNPNHYSYIKTQKDKMIDAGEMEDPYVTKVNQKKAEAQARKEQNAQIKADTQYMTKGEKAEYYKKINEQRKQEKAAKKEAEKQRKEDLKQQKAEYIANKKAEKEAKKQARIEAENAKKEEKAKQAAENKLRLEELKQRQLKEDEANKLAKEKLAQQKASEKNSKESSKGKKSNKKSDSESQNQQALELQR